MNPIAVVPLIVGLGNLAAGNFLTAGLLFLLAATTPPARR